MLVVRPSLHRARRAMPAIPGLYGSWIFPFCIHGNENAQWNGLALLCGLAPWVKCFKRGSKGIPGYHQPWSLFVWIQINSECAMGRCGPSGEASAYSRNLGGGRRQSGVQCDKGRAYVRAEPLFFLDA